LQSALQALGASAHGLTLDEARLRLERYGPNRLTEPILSRFLVWRSWP
jgi:hypothetical protein